MLELDHTNTPHTRTHHHLQTMLACHPRGPFHHFDAKRGAVSRLTLFGGVVERAMRGKTDNLAWMEVTLERGSEQKVA